ncbi:unnamed protein product [Dicrocoelium dendriticum]|nr:unnamed protein product [Dicrocoelium dendriticum]
MSPFFQTGQFTVNFKIKVAQIGDDKSSILRVVTKNDLGKNADNWTLFYVLFPDGTLVTEWGSGEQSMPAHSQSVIIDMAGWTTVLTTVKLRTLELATSVRPVYKSIWEREPVTGTGLQRNRRDWDSSAHDIPTNLIKKVDAMNFRGNAFVRYDFRNRIIKDSNTETLTIDFELPLGVEEGLLWFSENTATKSYVYIKASRLHYTYVVIDQTGKAKLTLTEEIFLNTPLAANIPHALSIIRDKENLTLTLNERSHASKAIDGRVPLVPSDGYATLGGSQDPLTDTDGKVDGTFRGRIIKADVAREGDKRVDLLQIVTDPHWQDSVEKTGQVTYEYREPKMPLVIAPTASKPFRTSWGKVGTPMALALTREPIPITFMGTQSSVVRFDTWDFTVYRSFEMEFMTYEPRGILFFVGPDREHTDFVCVELYDGNVYFVYAVGDHYRHIQLNPEGMKVNNGMSNRVYVSRNEKHRFLIKFNDRIVDVDQGTAAHQTEFATYTYIGSVDQPSRLPWHVWSRENFAGCISSIRINDDKFLDPSSRMSQHTDVSRGIQFGVCRVPDRRCTRETCGGGQCAERSYPFFEPLNYACDCSGSDKTFREGVTDIRRSEACFRDSPVLDMDGEMALLIDFERGSNTLTTHTDDISLQFRTQQSTVPLFYAVSPADKSFFRVDLIGGLIRIQTNINHPDNRVKTEEFFSTGTQLNDNQWHTLRILRRAEHLTFSVDGRTESIGKIPLQSQLKTFKLVAQQIYLGSTGLPNYARPSPPTADVKSLPPPPRFIGEFRNFYWNEYDFIGTGSLPNKYTTDMLTPRAVLPTFPQWPREPTYSITCKPQLSFSRLDRPINVQDDGDMWLIEFRTEYDGVIYGARESGVAAAGSHITLALLRGRLHVIYSINGRSGVHQLTSGPSANKLNDGQWHRVALGFDRRKKQLITFLDSYPPEHIGSGLAVNRIKTLTFHFGGLPEAEWQSVLALVRNYAPASVQSTEAEQGKQPAFTGCLGSFSLRADGFTADLLRRHDSELRAYPPNQIVRGFCRDQRRCTPDYCHRGRCEQVSEREIRCICTGTGYEGPRCESQVIECPPNYCNQRGRCSVVNGQPKCDCSGTGYYGDRCELSPCIAAGGYCFNGGVCTMLGSMPTCNCEGTGYRGEKCQEPICPPNYCQNNGRCRVGPNQQPVCDCSGTGHTGPRCEKPACRPDMCSNGGRCVLNVYGVPECNCAGTGFKGPECRTPICTPDHCANRGRCVVGPNDLPLCECRGTGYTGDRCQIPICTINYCSHGGRCVVGPNDLPQCECRGTGYGGDRCQTPVCTEGYCSNGGRCLMGPNDLPRCECRGTGYTGDRCQVRICTDGYCSNGGRCVVGPNDQPMCDCAGTGYGGNRCTEPVCVPGLCQNGGRCHLDSSGKPTCSCEGTGFTGSRCQTPICSPGYCLNNGRCSIDINNEPVCNCAGTGHRGGRCETPICTPGHCLHGGLCRVNEAGQPVCDCLLTNYHGERCETPLCPPAFCGGRGLCVVRQRQPTCDCHSGYSGLRCELEVCPENYCINGGFCTPGPDKQPICTCPVNYEGDRCHLPKVCPSDYCFHGGRCTMVGGVPQCDCLGTDYTGTRCEIAQTCPVGFCQNGGRCAVKQGKYVCDCSGTGFRGVICNEPIACPPNYCLYGGICSVLGDKQYVCDCARTGRTGKHCEGSSQGIYVNYEKDGYFVYPLIPPVRTVEDNVTFGFKTYMQTGTLLTFMTADGRHWAIRLCHHYLGFKESRGFMPYESGNGAYVIYTINPQRRTNVDEMRVAFQTFSKDGPIARVVQSDGSFYDFVMVDGKVQISFNGQQYAPIGPTAQYYHDGRMHVVSVKRNNRTFNITLDGYRTIHEPPGFVGVDGSLITREVVLGADRQFKKTFDGVIGAFYWNGQYLINERGSFVSDATVMTGPGRVPAKSMDEVVVVLMPHLLRPTTPHQPRPPQPLPDGLPEGSIAGGVVMPGLGTGNVNLGAPIFVPGKGYGGGAAGMNAGTGLMLKQAGGVFGMGGLVDALLAGLLLALLLLISALIWACWRCKPGCCGFCYGKSTVAGRKGATSSAWDRLVGLCCAAPTVKSKERETLINGTDIQDHSVIPPYISGPPLDLSPGFPSPTTATIPIEHPIPIPDQNIYNLEGMKVDSILITKNSKYFVTGSGMGPPKVWDSTSGEVFKLMEGNELACTDLNLACDDTVLVSQVVDDLSGHLDTLTDMNAIRVKRLQLWDFASGGQLEMPVEIMCTATCLTRKSEHVIVARSSASGPSILAWNLPANQSDTEIFYEPISPALRDSVTYLNISHDDRLVVAGCKNEEQACYMVFDLAAHYTVPAQPRIVVFDAEVNATEIIGPDTAVTGTRKGELLVWNLHTGEVIRQIQITATLEAGTLTTFSPHSETIHCIQLSEDRQYLVTGSQDQLVRVWSMPDERLLHTLEGHADDVLSVAISRDSELVVSGSWDGSIRVWRLRDGNQICWFSSNIEILQVKISNDKRSLVALGERNDHRKLITLRVVRNRVRTTTSVRPAGSRLNSSLSPPTMSPNSPAAMV